MKKIYISILLVLIFAIIILILIKNNIVILKNGKIDGLKYTIFERNIETISKIIDNSNLENLNYQDLSQLYYSATFNNSIYRSVNSSLTNEEYIDYFLDDITLTTINELTAEKININGSVYKIKNISEKVAILINFNDTNDYYTYINSYCKPDTLEDLDEMFDFKEYLSFNNVNYIKNVSVKNILKNNINLEYLNIDDDYLYNNILYNNLNNNVEYFENEELNQYFVITTDSTIYGSKFDFYLTKDDKLIISIPAIGNTFICDMKEDSYNNLVGFIKDIKANAIVTTFFYEL